jgi:V/A-type H+-transporting ATPase subunit E
MAKAAEQVVSMGVDELVKKLEKEGVNKGQAKADEIIAQAEAKANAILDKAHKEAEKHRAKVQEEIEKSRATAEGELKMVARDSILKMRKDLENTFAKQVQRLISDKTMDEDMLERLIVEVVGKSKARANLDEADEVELILPEKVIGLDFLRENPKRVKEGRLSKLVMGMTKEMLREGVTFSSSDRIKGGFKVFLKKDKVEIDISDKAIADILMEHLQPRFRAILEGVIK